jgi:hypothetical protein
VHPFGDEANLQDSLALIEYFAPILEQRILLRTSIHIWITRLKIKVPQ